MHSWVMTTTTRELCRNCTAFGASVWSSAKIVATNAAFADPKHLLLVAMGTDDPRRHNKHADK